MGTRLRPSFELRIQEPPALLLEHAELRLRAPDCPLSGLVTPSRIELYVPPSRRGLRSTELRVEVHPAGTGSRLTGTYGRHPHVWATLFALYAASSISAFFALTFVLSQWVAGEPITAVYALVTLLVLVAVVRASSILAMSGDEEEMEELRAFLHDLIAEVEPPISAPLRSGIRAARPSESDAPAARERGGR